MNTSAWKNENCLTLVVEHQVEQARLVSFGDQAVCCSYQIGLDMTMQRSEYTDPDSSRRFPVEAGSATTSAAGTGGTAPALAGAITSATATEVRQADVLSGRGKSFTKHHGNLRFDGT